jgi:hypothetical protein
MAPTTSRNVRLAILLIAWAIGGWEFSKRFIPLVPTSQVTIPEDKSVLAISDAGIAAVIDSKWENRPMPPRRYGERAHRGPIDLWDVPKGVRLPTRLTNSDEILDVSVGDPMLLIARNPTTISVIDAQTGTILCQRPLVTNQDDGRLANSRFAILTTQRSFAAYDLQTGKKVWSRYASQFQSASADQITCRDEGPVEWTPWGESLTLIEQTLDLLTGAEIESHDPNPIRLKLVADTDDERRSPSAGSHYLAGRRPPNPWLISLDNFAASLGLDLFGSSIRDSSAEVIDAIDGRLFGCLSHGVLFALPGDRKGFFYETKHALSYYEFPGRRNWLVIMGIIAGPLLLIGLFVGRHRRRTLLRAATSAFTVSPPWNSRTRVKSGDQR